MWRTEPDGPNDKEVEIWNTETGNWVPAFFSEIKAGDFYLLYGTHLPENQCFYAATDVIRYIDPRRWDYDAAPKFMIKNGTEIRQAPAMRDINPALEAPAKKPALKGPTEAPAIAAPFPRLESK